MQSLTPFGIIFQRRRRLYSNIYRHTHPFSRSSNSHISFPPLRTQRQNHCPLIDTNTFSLSLSILAAAAAPFAVKSGHKRLAFVCQKDGKAMGGEGTLIENGCYCIVAASAASARARCICQLHLSLLTVTAAADAALHKWYKWALALQ